ncbi:MAG: hypothetical protein HS105_04050 [Chloracidobacterium sp.]|nr:hypothetical protein [Chloracidobacterium sp.]MCO5333607.1 hypothetical protein [Pyrinomonadaceae bacterium]
MNKDCPDIGTIQAFLDAELSAAEHESVNSHFAVCGNCAAMLAGAESEAAVVFPALEREMDTLVPTQRLWSRINAEIAHDRRERSLLGGFRSLILSLVASPGIAAACVLLLTAAVTLSLLFTGTSRVANNRDVAGTLQITAPANEPAVETPVKPIDNNAAPAVISTESRPDQRRLVVVRASYSAARSVPAANTRSSGALAGEGSYLETIAALQKSVGSTKDLVLQPAERVAYERDMAVVDDTIEKMRTAVRKDPKDDAARQMLFTSYKNKIDLLNSLSQTEELVASIR